MTLTVGKNGEFKSVSDALTAAERLDGEVKLHVFPGEYHEKLEVRRPGIIIEGESPENTVITYGDFANGIMPDGSRRGTFRSYTVLLDAPGIRLENLTVKNSAGFNEDAGQAIALYAEGEGITVINCRITSKQDSLFTGPLPEKERISGGFAGPKEHSPRLNGRQYYRGCRISGGVDFIFGSATACFEDCVIESLAPGYVTAGSSPKGQKYGYLFTNCDFVGNCPEKSVYLGRPWRDYAKVVIRDCRLGGHIRPEGWNDWQREITHETAFFAEYNNTGPGADISRRVSWAHVLSDEEAEEYTVKKIIGEV